MANRDKHNVDNQAQQTTIKEWRENIEQNYTYCMISTLNQMVNYIPMLLFDFQQPKMYLTLKGNEQNLSYDKYLFDTCQNLVDAGARFGMPANKIEIGSVNDVQALQNTLLEKAPDKPILWNITGGQRPFVMAIFELLKEEAREDDLVMYLEGNSGEIVFLKVDENKILQKVDTAQHSFETYAITCMEPIEWLTIRIALQLMGFDANTTSKNLVGKTEHSHYQKFLEKYIANESLRKKLLALNKKDNQMEGETTYHNKEILKESNITTYFNELTSEELDLIVLERHQAYPFGHFLEKLYAHAIYGTLEDDIAEIATNVRLHYADESAHREAGEKHIDELDIAVLTKTGQLIVFEVKSGTMSGDVAKSTKYTTYAIAGVYGKPVLLTALLKDQLNNTSMSNKDWAYASSASAVAAARRAQLSVICLDGNEHGDFNLAIKKLLHLL